MPGPIVQACRIGLQVDKIEVKVVVSFSGAFIHHLFAATPSLIHTTLLAPQIPPGSILERPNGASGEVILNFHMRDGKTIICTTAVPVVRGRRLHTIQEMNHMLE